MKRGLLLAALFIGLTSTAQAGVPPEVVTQCWKHSETVTMCWRQEYAPGHAKCFLSFTDGVQLFGPRRERCKADEKPALVATV